MQEFWWI